MTYFCHSSLTHTTFLSNQSVVGSTYLGGFLNGLWHISDGNTIGTWVSTLETKYEGTFLYGLKHGRGKQTFLDGSYYEGEFAKGYEHGSGRIVYPDGNIFTGKFRFGRRDGPGELVTRDRIVMEKGLFRDSGMPFTDVYPPFVEELSKSDVATIVSAGKTSLFDPESLLDLCFKAISQNLKEPRLLGKNEILHLRLVSSHYLTTHPYSSVISYHTYNRCCMIG